MKSIRQKSTDYNQRNGIDMKLLNLSAVLLLTSLSLSTHAYIGAGHVSGEITNISSVPQGLLVMIEGNEVPQNCTSGNTWMQISEDNQSMTSMLITAWTLDRNVAVYTSPASTGYCEVWQVDPYEQ